MKKIYVFVFDCNSLLKQQTAASKILEIPLVVTEQYPKGLGSTVEELDISNAAVVAPKTKFSMLVPEVSERHHFIGSFMNKQQMLHVKSNF